MKYNLFTSNKMRETYALYETISAAYKQKFYKKPLPELLISTEFAKSYGEKDRYSLVLVGNEEVNRDCKTILDEIQKENKVKEKSIV